MLRELTLAAPPSHRYEAVPARERPLSFSGVYRIRALLLLGLLAACGGQGAVVSPASTGAPVQVVTAVSTGGVSAPPPELVRSGATVVELGDHWYAPAQIHVTVGTKVTWKQVGAQEHDVVSESGLFRSPTLGPGGTYSYTFDVAPGTYRYFCVPHHGDGMIGAVTVVPRR
ncbi:MAG: hypothetical protein FJ028_07460 [Chloroflexi bacterium]|nr:hypothetical protein [Chloroflexota bacterium]